MFNSYLGLILENQYGQKYTLLEIVEMLREYVKGISFDDIEEAIAELEATLADINGDLDDLSQRITDLDIANLKERMRTAELDVATLKGILEEVNADLDVILQDPDEDTVPHKVDRILDAKTAIRSAILNKGGEVPVDLGIEDYPDAVATIIDASAITHVQTATYGEGVNLSEALFDLVVPNYDANHAPIIAVGMTNISSDFNNVRSLKCGQFVTSLGQYAKGNNLVEIDAPFAVNVSNQIFSGTYNRLQRLHCAVTEINNEVARIFGSSYAYDDTGFVFDAPNLVSYRGTWGFGNVNNPEREIVFNVPALQRWDIGSEYAVACSGEFYAPAMKTVNGVFVDNADGMNLDIYFPALEAINEKQFVYNYFIYDNDGAGVVNLYIGANLATLATNQANNLATAITNGILTVHIPAGASTTKATLDAKGVSYVQDYDPEM